ncbi:hypothetical protein MUN82_18150 [Hymenobacter aerilatus]|uniref:Uncharacterized protein n=1 Tax=Hymenobacter aerilatus TaxID=2932251 RepID=A0A8T9SRV9_9BACT|nr:hypothetical protein [Hymenobacter aerilatus]UOR04852.1 hypothetical protein MUN82_18150 [Hymenobacter aerilatus]
MILFQAPEVLLTYHHQADMLQLTYSATTLSMSFGEAYQLALEEMLRKKVGKLLLDLKRNAPPTDDEEHLLAPLSRTFPPTLDWPVYIAAVLSEGQYQHQIGSYLMGNTTLTPAQVEFNYFTSRHEANAWLSDN